MAFSEALGDVYHFKAANDSSENIAVKFIFQWLLSLLIKFSFVLEDAILSI